MTGANRSIAASSRSGNAVITVPTPASARARYRPIWSVTVPALTTRRSARRSGAGPEPLDDRRQLGRVAADEGRRQLRHLDRGRIAADRLAVRAEHGGLVRHRVDVADDVAGIGVLRNEPQGAALAAAADEDRHVFLERPRVADRLRHVDDPALVRGRALAPQQWQELERVLQEGVALVGRRERPAVGRVLVGVPREPETAERAAAREHVERRDDLAEVGDVPERDAGDQRAEPHTFGDSREIRERRVALEHGFPLRAEHGDLAEVVHHRDAREAGGFGRFRNRPQSRAGVPPARPGYTGMLSPNRSVVGAAACVPPAPRTARSSAGAVANDGRFDDDVEALVGEARLQRARARGPAAVSTRSGTDLPRARLRALHSTVGVANATHTVASAVAAREVEPPRRRSASRPRVSTTVVRRRPTRASTICSSSANASALAAQVGVARADDRPQRIARHDLLGREVRRRPTRLSRTRRSGEHHEARRGQHDVVARHA